MTVASGIPGPDDERGTLERALDALDHGVAVIDRTGRTRLLADGPDFLDLVHRLGTNAVSDLEPGRGRPTVLTSAKGRILERVSLHHLGPRGVAVLAGRGRAASTMAHLAKYTFAEVTGLADVTETTAQVDLIGPEASALASGLGLPTPGPWGVAHGVSGAHDVVVLATDGTTAPNLALWVSSQAREATLDACGAAANARPRGARVSEEHFDVWRVRRGVGADGREYTEDANPLEVGLRDHVDFRKGCYVGQEVIARLETYDKVARRVTGLRFAARDAPEAPADLYRDERRVGRLTTVVRAPDADVAEGLALLKREIPAGTDVAVGDERRVARVVEPRSLEGSGE